MRSSGEARVSLPPASVVVDHVSMTYRTTQAPASGRRARVVHALKSVVGRNASVRVEAVRNVSFVAHKGDAIGVLGRNGSGKSTLMRVIAGVETPTAGAVYAESAPALLGVSAALVPALPGIRNVEIGCLAMGMTPAQVEAVTPEILEIAALGDAIRRPMQTYSSGMRARLGFAIAVSAKPDILLVDEALSTGDSTTQERADAKMAEMLAGSGTVFIVNHAIQTLEDLCSRALWLHDGVLIADGPTLEVTKAYRWWGKNVNRGDLDVAEQALREVTEAWGPAGGLGMPPALPRQRPARHACP